MRSRDPASLQECATTGAVTVCVYPVHRPLLHRMLERHHPDRGRLARGRRPADAAPALRRRPGRPPAGGPTAPRPRTICGSPRRGAPRVRRGVRGARRDRGVPAGPGRSRACPTRPTTDLLPVVAAGQARGVVALWLAHAWARRRGGPGPDHLTAARLARTRTERGALEEGDCSVPSVVWSAQDLLAARSIVALPSAEVASVLAADWAPVVDPRTGTDELLAALGLARRRSLRPRRARAGQPVLRAPAVGRRRAGPRPGCRTSARRASRCSWGRSRRGDPRSRRVPRRSADSWSSGLAAGAALGWAGEDPCAEVLAPLPVAAPTRTSLRGLSLLGVAAVSSSLVGAVARRLRTRVCPPTSPTGCPRRSRPARPRSACRSHLNRRGTSGAGARRRDRRAARAGLRRCAGLPVADGAAVVHGGGGTPPVVAGRRARSGCS